MKKGLLYRKRTLLITLVIGICHGIAYGQTEKYLLPTEIKEQTIITEPATLQKGFFRTGIILSHTFADKIFNESNKRISPTESASAETKSIALGAHYGLTDRLQLNLYVPYISNKMSASSIREWPGVDSIVSDKWQRDAKGLGDMELGVYYQVLTEKPKRPSVTLRTTFRFNTG